MVTPPRGAGESNPAPEVPSTAHVPKDLPLGVSPTLYAISVPAGREPTPEQVALGDKLFNDKRLSVDGTVSCATCHDPKAGFVDHKATSEGIQAEGPAQRPTVLNAMFNATQFWDGRAPTLEEQAKLPILNPIEMGHEVAGRRGRRSSRAIPEYAGRVPERLRARRELRRPRRRHRRRSSARSSRASAPFDRFIIGDEKRHRRRADAGWALFNGKGRCNECHAGNAVSPLFSDQKFHNIGVAAHKQNFAAAGARGLAVVSSGDAEADRRARHPDQASPSSAASS